MSYILAIESSCDEMSVAILKDKREMLSNQVASQIDVHRLYGGVVPEIASRMHVECVSTVLKTALNEANVDMKDIDAIAVTKGPGLVGSLHVGMQAAKTLALAYHKPLIGVHHIAGHIYANELVEDIEYPCLCLVVSGGHSELVYMKKPFSFEVIGQTLDDAIGEAYDKVGRVLHLPYPGGPVIDKMAKVGKHSYNLPLPLNDDSYNFSFSGLKSAVINLSHNASQRGEELVAEDLACSFQEVALEVLVSKTIKAAKDYNVKEILVAGGVSANQGLREKLTRESSIKVLFPPMKYCTDNAAMIAAAGYFAYKKGIPLDESGNGGGYVFDCRSIHNPGRYKQYKQLTGMDKEVIDFLEEDGEILSFLDHVYGVVDPHVETYASRGFTSLMVNFGCTGGQHRSVYCAESLARHLRAKYPDVHIILSHREQNMEFVK